MANSKDTPYSDRNRLQSKILDALYYISNGYKHTFVPLDNLYKQLHSNSKDDQKRILESFQYLRENGLVDSRALGTASITHEGIKELENILLGLSDLTDHTLSGIDTPLTSQDEINSIQNKRTEFLKKAYELSKGSTRQPVSAFKIMEMLGYDQKTLERIYYYLEDEGLIKTFALGGNFTITQKYIEQQAGHS
jgi:CTP-dependent riboflavin kinase